jgi:hypothetical protein
MPRLHWTRERVVLEIRRLDARGERLATRRLQSIGLGGLVAAGYKLFGSWGEALRQAGVAPPPPLPRGRTLESILARIRQMAETGQDLSCGAVREHDHRLVSAACRHPALGNWSRALELAGIAGRVRHARWTREQILSEIRRLAGEGSSLSFGAVRATRQDLASAACRKQHFGSWEAAVAAAGLDYHGRRRRPAWTRQRVMNALVELHAAGAPLTTSWLQRNGWSSLVAVARRPSMFGSWRDALECAGIDYEQARREAREATRGL